MSDLISRQAAIDACHNWDDGKNYYAYGDTVEERLQKLPPAQPGIIRCKDCRWREQEQPGMVYCPNIMGNWVEDEWYCADGEAREE